MPLALVVSCVVAAAFLGVWPFRLEYSTAEKLAESRQLTSAVAEIQKLEGVAGQIRAATSQWQTVQDHSARTVAAAKDIGDRIAAEAKAFSEFMQKANESEKAHLRLEVEKLRRGETEWLHAVIRLLDHVFALHQAAVRSGHRSVIQQLSSFQDACRDITRRVGLTPLEAIAGEAFDDAKHQLMDGQPPPPDGALVEDTLATGYSFQGQLLRRTVVNLQQTVPTEQQPAAPSQATAESATEDLSGPSDNAAEALAAEGTVEQTLSDAQEETADRLEDESFRLESESLVSEDSRDRQA
jgi:molecular chaperone GrpE (heat shock protein)